MEGSHFKFVQMSKVMVGPQLRPGQSGGLRGNVERSGRFRASSRQNLPWDYFPLARQLGEDKVPLLLGLGQLAG
jgi:hypothetical protein